VSLLPPHFFLLNQPTKGLTRGGHTSTSACLFSHSCVWLHLWAH
jgi:hypothetical protein